MTGNDSEAKRTFSPSHLPQISWMKAERQQDAQGLPVTHVKLCAQAPERQAASVHGHQILTKTPGWELRGRGGDSGALSGSDWWDCFYAHSSSNLAEWRFDGSPSSPEGAGLSVAPRGRVSDGGQLHIMHGLH